VSGTIAATAVAFAMATTPLSAVADETCQSPYMAKITGQEEFVYVWTLGMQGMGDESDKLVTIDVRPDSATYGKVVNSVSVGGRHEAHHMRFTDDRRYLWAVWIPATSTYSTFIRTSANRSCTRRSRTSSAKAAAPSGRTPSTPCPAG